MKKQAAVKKGLVSAAMACAMVFAVCCDSFGSTITLQWDPVVSPDLAGYKVYYSTDPAAPFNGVGAMQGASPVMVSNETSTTITGLDPEQPYYFTITAYNTAGVESPYSNVVSVPELVPPTVAITSPATDSPGSGTVSVMADASDNVGVTKLEFYVNGVMQASDTSTPYLYSWDTSSAAAGANTLMAKAYDAAGNVAQSSTVSVMVVRDTTAPTVAMSAPGSGATVRGAVPVTATATDDTGVTLVELYANGTLLAAGNAPPYSYNWDTTAIADGAYTLYSKAYDAAGNVGQSANVTVNVLNDAIPPTVSITSPIAGTTGGSVLVSANASDNVAVSRVEFYVNGTLQSTSTSAPYGFTWNTSSIANGSYTLSAKAYDTTGNVGQSTNVAVNVFNDSIAPTVSISSPAAGTFSGPVAIAANATDNVAVSRVEFFINGSLQATSTTAPYGFTWNTNSVANGPYTLSAKAYDASGNVGQSASVAVSVFNDTSAPVVNGFSIPATATTLTVPVTVAATDNVAVTGYYISESQSAPAAAAGWTAATPTSFTFADYGARTAYVWARDAAGNISASRFASTTLTAPDTTAPAITSLSPSNGSRIGNGMVTITASATDNVAVTSMELYIDNFLQAATAGGNLSWTVNGKQYYRGTAHIITIRAYDAANNMSTASVTVYK